MNVSKIVLSRFLLLALAAAGVLAGSSARADSRVQVGVSVSVSLPRGYVEINHGRDRYYYHRGVYYRRGPHGYVVVRPPRGVIIRDLPPGYARVYVDGRVYYRYDNIYYQTARGGYMVVEPPTKVVAVVPAPQAEPPTGDYQSVWVGDVEYQFKDGQFFKKTAEGLVWSPAPLGAITKTMPADARSVWFQDVEYFECDDVYFRKTPAGYQVVEAPWKKAEPAPAPGN